MSATKTRINISLSDSVRDALIKLARRDRMPEATKAARLLEIALEMEEDIIWNKLALLRDKGRPRYISHDKAWK